MKNDYGRLWKIQKLCIFSLKWNLIDDKRKQKSQPNKLSFSFLNKYSDWTCFNELITFTKCN
jgi:hypothetical protein